MPRRNPVRAACHVMVARTNQQRDVAGRSIDYQQRAGLKPQAHLNTHRTDMTDRGIVVPIITVNAYYLTPRPVERLGENSIKCKGREMHSKPYLECGFNGISILSGFKSDH